MFKEEIKIKRGKEDIYCPQRTREKRFFPLEEEKSRKRGIAITKRILSLSLNLSLFFSSPT